MIWCPTKNELIKSINVRFLEEVFCPRGIQFCPIPSVELEESRFYSDEIENELDLKMGSVNLVDMNKDVD